MTIIENIKIPILKKTKINAHLFDAILIILGSLFITLCSKILIISPITKVPITFQTFAILLIGILYGSKRGLLTVLTYLIKGLIGLPVFAYGSTGISYIFGPTGGYLLGFIFAVYIVGLLAEKGLDKNLFYCFVTLLIGNLIIYFFGLMGLLRFVEPKFILEKGFYPFIIGDLLKLSLAMWIAPIGWKLLNYFTK